MNKVINSEKGFGIVGVIAALLIVSIGITGFFVSAFYARKKAVENYHYRAAILGAAAKLELIRYYNRNNQGEAFYNGIPSLTSPVVLDVRNGVPLEAQVNVSKSTYGDPQVAPYAVFDAIKVTLTWIEESNFIFNPDASQLKTLVLREDYFRRTDQ
jgi:type II secretory pathway pseudopilin PulG